MNKKIFFRIIVCLLLISATATAQDANFHIYLCFGQSNMEGHGKVEAMDTVGIDKRFQVMAAVDCPNLARTKGKWYTAVPPLCRCNTGLTPADYFGRTMAANLPENIRIGVINVSIGGCKIELFDKNNYESYVATAPDWMRNFISQYGGNPYARLVEMAKIAQKDGVIKGILLHQGESNTNDEAWPQKVKTVYDNLLKDLNLQPNSIPLLAGEMLSAGQNGACASMNNIINKLPQTIPNTYVISSEACEGVTDRLHFSPQGYRVLGKRYANQMLTILGYIQKAYPFPDTSVKLKPSWIQQRDALNIQYLKSLDPDRLLHNFRVNAGLPSEATPLEGWEAPQIGLRGHFTGHYLSAVASVVENLKDKLLSDRLNYMVAELGKCQKALGNGYLSAFPERDFNTLETRFGGVWAPYYTYNKIMQGLLDVYVRTGNKQAYQMVSDMADYVERRMAKLDAESIEKMLYSVGANPSNEAGAMNEVLYKLYQVSKNPRHLALAKIFDRDWFLLPLAQNSDILSGLHSNTHIALVNGFAQRHLITGEALYYNAVENFWNMLMISHAYANGSSSGPRPIAVTPTSQTSEHWGKSGILSNTLTKEIAETCVSHNTQKLTIDLFSWTADPMYADAFMNIFYNAVLASQNANDGTNVYHLPLGSPIRKSFLKENDFRCCNGSTIEAFALLNRGIYYHNGTNLWVNGYVPSELSWMEKDVVLHQTGDFPNNPSIDFTVSTKKAIEFNLNLFVPSWAKSVEVYINGVKQQKDIMPLSYLNIRREWKNGDKVRLVFHYDFRLKTMPDDKNVVAVFYGPALLAFETNSELILKGSHDEISKNLSRIDDNSFRLVDNGREYILRPLYNIVNQTYGVYATIRNY